MCQFLDFSKIILFKTKKIFFFTFPKNRLLIHNLLNFQRNFLPIERFKDGYFDTQKLI